MRAKYQVPALDEVGMAGAPGPPPERLRRFDAMSHLEFLRRQGASPDAALLLTLGAGSNEHDYASALMRLRGAFWRSTAKRWYKIRGGNDQLPKAFAAALSDWIYYGAQVVRIEHSTRGVRVTVLRGGTPSVCEGDHVVCSIPFSVLRQVEVRPALSAPLQRAIRELHYGPVTKVFALTRSRFWEAERLSGFAVTDRAIQEVWNLSAAQPGKRGLLVAYMTGSNAEQAARLAPEERISWAAGEIERLLPGVVRDLEGGASQPWGLEAWSRGAYPIFAAGQVIPMLGLLRRPEGRVHFAGDHTSAWPGWMQGALESANRTVREIDSARESAG